jgi:hypothetical protein
VVYPPKAEVRGSNPFGRAKVFRQLGGIAAHRLMLLSAECPRNEFAARSQDGARAKNHPPEQDDRRAAAANYLAEIFAESPSLTFKGRRDLGKARLALLLVRAGELTAAASQQGRHRLRTRRSMPTEKGAHDESVVARLRRCR